MERVRRPRISAADRTQLWTRWKRGESLSDIGRALDAVAERLNSRPRKTLGYDTPADRLAATVASTS